eukprot:scaffold3616_cov49-Attheya_sp.AAC.1
MDQAGVGTVPDSNEFSGDEALLMVGVLVLGLIALVVVLYAFIACIDISILGDESSILRCSRIRTCLAHHCCCLFHSETAPAPSTERSQNDMELGVMRHITRDDTTTTTTSVSKRMNAIMAGLQTTERVEFLDMLLPSKVVVAKGDQSLPSLKEQNIIMSSGSSDGTKDTNMEWNDSNEMNDATGYPICSICLGNIDLVLTK